jgi:hypothetical protein
MTGRLRARLAVELAIYREALCALAGRVRPSARRMADMPHGRRYTLHRGELSSILLPLVILTSCVDVPLLHLFIHIRAPEPMRLALHAVVIGTTLCGLLWVIGDRSSVKNLDHVLVAGELVLNVGYRASCRLPIASIGAVRQVNGKPAEWRAVLGLKKSDVTSFTPMDSPNLLIELKASPGRLTCIRFGIERALSGHVAVYADRPTQLTGELMAMLSMCHQR